MFHDRTCHERNVSWWGCFIMRTVSFAMRMLQNGVWVQEKCNLIAELGARQHFRDNVTIFFRPKVAYNFIMYIFVVSTPFIHQGLNIFRNFLVTEAPLRCHDVVVAKLTVQLCLIICFCFLFCSPDGTLQAISRLNHTQFSDWLLTSYAHIFSQIGDEIIVW